VPARGFHVLDPILDAVLDPVLDPIPVLLSRYYYY
ncbi:hypothetical protein PENNAL_c0813G09878, partial [Penicillium nalgiovense]